ncbi:trypsin-like peptidase domain-containing protein [Streptomyces collinus]|uniref:trypsin-like peptidase domain-containing protein n=1 Tax=Streptomyces collinus TaxID=42684 RepID=UPI0036395FF2
MEIIVTLPSGQSRRGTGYSVAPGRVLTAAHVVEGVHDLKVRFQADRPGERTVEATVHWWHTGIDVAVLDLAQQPQGPDTVPVSYGRVGERDAVLRCTTLGFPRFKLRTDERGSRFRDTEHIHATCAVLSNRREGTLDLAVTNPPADDPDPRHDAWGGMSGAAVFAGGRLVAVVTRHHRSDGPGRIAASRVDRWAETLKNQLPELTALLSHPLRPDLLPDATPVVGFDRIQEVYHAQLADIAPAELRDRETELSRLAEFCGGADPYLWVQGPPWAGKTALAASFALHPPQGVVPVWFFVTGRSTVQSHGGAYTAAVIDQLAAIAGRERVLATTDVARDGERSLLLGEAAQDLAQRGGTLLLVVDGLDEDQSLHTGEGPSIASLLPGRPPPNVRVLVTSRTRPGLPVDVASSHPLRRSGCRMLHLSANEAARHTEIEAKKDLRQLLAGDSLRRDLVGLLTAARGTLTAEDLRELTGRPNTDVRPLLDSAFGRILDLRGPGAGDGVADHDRDEGGDTSLYLSGRGYLFAHDTLFTAAQTELGHDVTGYLDRLHAWADSYGLKGWPAETPAYLLQPYGRLLALIGDAKRATAHATDARRRDRMREATGSDAACIAELAAARETVRKTTPDDLATQAVLSVTGDLVARRNAALHPDVPAVHARLGRVPAAIGMARSVYRITDRARALAGVARVLTERGDMRAIELAQEAVRLQEEHRPSPGSPAASYYFVRCTLAATLAQFGHEEEAARQVLHWRKPHRGDSGLFVMAVIETARAFRQPARAVKLLEQAEGAADRAENGPARIRLLVAVARAWAEAGFEQAATRLDRSVFWHPSQSGNDRFAIWDPSQQRKEHAEHLHAIAIHALLEQRESVAASMAWLTTPEPGPSYDRRPVFAEVYELLTAHRTEDAAALMERLRNPFAGELGFVPWDRDADGRRDPEGERRLLADAWASIARAWAREGRAEEAVAALRRCHGYERTFDGDHSSVLELLIEAGSADGLEALLVSSRTMGLGQGRDSRVVLAAHFAALDPERAWRLLGQVESDGQEQNAPTRAEPTHLARLAGALATVGRAEAAERLLAAITDARTHAWACAVVSLAVAEQDGARAQRLAEEACSASPRWSFDRPPDGMLTAAAQALARSGMAERVADLLGKWVTRTDHSRSHAPAILQAATGLWPYAPGTAGRLLGELRLRKESKVPGTSVRSARLLAEMRPDAGASVARVQEVLSRPERYRSLPYDALEEAVLLAVLDADTDPAAARQRIGTALSERASWLGRNESVAVAAVVLDSTGDSEAAAEAAHREGDAAKSAVSLLCLAAHAAGMSGVSMAVSLLETSDLAVPLCSRLALCLLPCVSNPDLPRARSLLVEAITPDTWHRTLPVLALLDPDAVLRVHEVVLAHLGLDP